MRYAVQGSILAQSEQYWERHPVPPYHHHLMSLYEHVGTLTVVYHDLVVLREGGL